MRRVRRGHVLGGGCRRLHFLRCGHVRLGTGAECLLLVVLAWDLPLWRKLCQVHAGHLLDVLRDVLRLGFSLLLLGAQRLPVSRVRLHRLPRGPVLRVVWGHRLHQVRGGQVLGKRGRAGQLVCFMRRGHVRARGLQRLRGVHGGQVRLGAGAERVRHLRCGLLRSLPRWGLHGQLPCGHGDVAWLRERWLLGSLLFRDLLHLCGQVRGSLVGREVPPQVPGGHLLCGGSVGLHRLRGGLLLSCRGCGELPSVRGGHLLGRVFGDLPEVPGGPVLYGGGRGKLPPVRGGPLQHRPGRCKLRAVRGGHLLRHRGRRVFRDLPAVRGGPLLSRPGRCIGGDLPVVRRGPLLSHPGRFIRGELCAVRRWRLCRFAGLVCVRAVPSRQLCRRRWPDSMFAL